MKIAFFALFIFLFTLVQSSDTEKVMIAGFYEVCSRVTARRTFEIISGEEPLREYNVGDIVKVVEVKKNVEANRIRGQLEDGTWISMKNTEDDFVWVVTVQLNHNYERYASQFFNQDNAISMTDETGKEYVFDSWINVQNMAIYHHYECTELNPRKYVVIHDKDIQSTLFATRYSSWAIKYPPGTILDIIKITYLPSEDRIRGQVKGSLDWVSIKHTATGYTWLEPVKPETKTYEFTPGPLGFKFVNIETGIISAVLSNSQASNYTSIRPGWKILKINNRTFSEDLVKKNVQGDKPFFITFAVYKNLIKLDVLTQHTYAGKKLTIEFNKLDGLLSHSDQDSSSSCMTKTIENFKHFFKMFENIHQHSSYDTKLKIKDHYSPQSPHQNLNLLNSNLKFSYFLKYGETFFEQFNFQYVVKLSAMDRQLKNQKLRVEDLKIIREEHTNIHFPETFSDLVKQIEFNYSEKESESIFVDIFYSYFKKTNFFNDFPVAMVYHSPVKRDERASSEQKMEKSKSMFRLFSFGNSKSTLKPKDESDNFL